MSLSGVLTPLLLTPVVDSIGWRNTWTLLGVVTLLVMFPVALTMRRAPESYGLLPDGQIVGAVRNEKEQRAFEAAQRDFERSLTVREAVRTPAMWLLVLSTGCSALGMTGVIMNSIPFLTDHGFTRTEASVAAAVQGGAALSATLP
jgi:sugar phosphate permease